MYFLLRYKRLWLKAFKAQRRLDNAEKRHALRLKNALAGKDKEIRRLNEMIAAYQAKLEAHQLTTLDRFFELRQLQGVSASTAAHDTRINKLRYEPFETVAEPDYKDEYEALRDLHFLQAERDGIDRLTAEHNWSSNEAQILESLKGY